MELYRAIVKLEEGGAADGVIKVYICFRITRIC